ncbi:sensor histidine kinase [Phycicoccus avicenniae]|uniref:sensor histidine kinase n=1 Tax=Phycicoccus avicenniae TaxID=2828860 RepID=UPI003D2D8610
MRELPGRVEQRLPARVTAGVGAVLVACTVLVALRLHLVGTDGWANGLAFTAMLVSALVVAREPTQRSSAALLAAAAASLAVSGLNGVSEAGWGGWWTMAGWCTTWWPVAALVPLFLVYPSPGFETAAARRLSLGLAGVVGARVLWSTLWDPAFGGPGAVPIQWVSGPWASAERLYAVMRVESVLIAAAMVLVTVLLVGRWRRASGPRRRPTRAVAAAGVVLASAVLVLQLAGLGWLGPAAPYDALLDLSLVLLTVAPLVILAVAVWSAQRRGRLVEALLRAEGDPAGIEATLRAALEDEHLRLHLRVPGGWADGAGRHTSTGSQAPLPDDLDGERYVLLADDEGPAVLVDVRVGSAAERATVDRVLSEASVALDRSRLALERTAHLTELRASRGRVVEAALAERRRLERDLHDGVQQHLLTVSATLARARLTEDPQERDAVLADARGQVAETMSEVRGIARGLHPTVLSQGGLPYALPRLEAADHRVSVEVGPVLAAAPRPDPDVEAALYYAAAELVTNALRHGDPRRVGVAAEATAPGADTGAGVRLLVEQMPPAPGVAGGVVHVRDRVEALGGRVSFAHSRTGTVVEVWVPLGPPARTWG